MRLSDWTLGVSVALSLPYLALCRDLLQSASLPVLPAPTPAQGPSAAKIPEAINTPLHFFNDTSLTAFPNYVYTGDRGCSPSALISFLTIEKQIVPVEEASHYAIRVLQTPSNSPTAVPDSVTYFDLETGSMVVGIPKLSWLQQTQNFNYTLYVPGVVDLRMYRLRLQLLTGLVNGLALGQQLNTSRYACSSPNPELQPLVDYLNRVAGFVANTTDIDGGLKKGIEYRVPGGCIIESDAYYAGDILTYPSLGSGGNSTMPSENDCCLACKGQASCNVFTFCPTFSGCQLGSKFVPGFTCELKALRNLTTDPLDFPAAILRGPPTAFKSGRFG